jgi:parallel beta-helix repeat protein
MATRVAALGSALAVFVLLLTGTGTASANHVQCGDVITQSTVLDSDIVDCPASLGWAIALRGQGIALDLGGHTVDGTGSGIGVSGQGSPRSDLSVFNGRVQQFRTGVSLISGPDMDVHDITVAENFYGVSLGDGPRALGRRITATANTTGINLSGSTDSVLRDNHLFDNEAGMGGGDIVGSLIEGNNIHDNAFGGLGWGFIQNSRIANNRVANNGLYGITLVEWSIRNLLAGNHVSGNGEDGIVIAEDSDQNTLDGNRSNENGDDGIDLDGPGNTVTRNSTFGNFDLGIEAAPGTIDGGKNKAGGNGNPLQCVGVTCK